MNAVPPLVPDHELFGVIGRGAFGEVWLARNVMGIWRAVKVIRRTGFARLESYEREFEAIQRYEPVARCTEGLVQVLHVGRNDAEGYFYYVMELGDEDPHWPKSDQSSKDSQGADRDRPLTPETYRAHTLRSELARGGGLNLPEILAVAAALARGLTHLHREKLVHRDIKPSNVIFVHGRARLADIGLVDWQGHPSFVGTEGYIAPEGAGTPAADIYSLGLVLYEMATGNDRLQFPQLPPEWMSPGDPTRWELHEVILRACEGIPERRYRSAAELEADLTGISGGQSVRERHVLARRSRRLKFVGVAASLGLLIASGWALLSKQRATMENEARLQAERLRAETELALVESHLAQATANRQTGHTGQRFGTLQSLAEALNGVHRLGTNSLALLPEHRQAEFIRDIRNEAIAALTRVDLREIGRWPAVVDRQWGMPLDHELRRIAVPGGSNTVRVLAVPEGSSLVDLPGGPAEVDLVGPFSPEGQYLMVRYKNRENWVWNLENRELRFRQAPESGHLRGVFWRGGVLVPQSGGGLTWRSLTEPAETRNLPTSEQLMWLMPAMDGSHLVGFTRWFKEACWLEGERLQEVNRRTLPGRVDMGEFAFSRDGRYLALTIGIGQVPVLDLADPLAPAVRLSGHSAEVVAAAFHPDGRYLITSSWDGTTRISDWAAGETHVVHDLWTSALRVSNDGSRCAMLEKDFGSAEITFYELTTPLFLHEWHPQPPETEPARKIPVRATMSPDSRWLVVGTAYGVRLLTVPELIPCLAMGSNETYAVRFSPQGNRLFAAGDDGRRIWDFSLSPAQIQSEKRSDQLARMITNYRHIPGHDERELTLGEDGDPVALLCGTRAFHRLSGSNTWRPIRDQGEHEWMATSSDGTWIAVVGQSRLRVLRLSDDTRQWETTVSGVCRFAFSPDGQSLAALDVDCLRRLEVISGREQWRVLRSDPYKRVGEVAWSQDGHWIAAPISRRDVSVVRAEGGEIAARLTSPSQAGITAPSFSPNGRYLVLTLADQSAQLWDLQVLHRELGKLGLDW